MSTARQGETGFGNLDVTQIGDMPAFGIQEHASFRRDQDFVIRGWELRKGVRGPAGSLGEES